MIYYRIATQKHQSTEWEWESAPVNSLEAVFRLGRQYGSVPAEQVRVFAASSVEYMDTLLVRENLGLSSNSLTLEQLLRDHQCIIAACRCVSKSDPRMSPRGRWCWRGGIVPAGRGSRLSRSRESPKIGRAHV